MVLVSTNKPEITKKPDASKSITWNDRSYQSYIDQGFAEYIPHKIEAPRNRLLKFLNEVDIRKGKIERTVTLIVRLKAIDYDDPKLPRKEYLYYEELWEGKNHLGIPLSPVTNQFEGMFYEVVTRPELDKHTGEHIHTLYSHLGERFYIPFSKKNVDDIIAKSAHTDKSNIRFVIKWSHEDSISTNNLTMNSAMRQQ